MLSIHSWNWMMTDCFAHHTSHVSSCSAGLCILYLIVWTWLVKWTSFHLHLRSSLSAYSLLIFGYQVSPTQTLVPTLPSPLPLPLSVKWTNDHELHPAHSCVASIQQSFDSSSRCPHHLSSSPSYYPLLCISLTSSSWTVYRIVYISCRMLSCSPRQWSTRSTPHI
jgi:hypothetical protein